MGHSYGNVENPENRGGKAGTGTSALSYDVPAQIYDIDGDGRNEVIFSELDFLVILDGLDGKEINRYPLLEELRVADCITFANLRGGESLFKFRVNLARILNTECKVKDLRST